MRSLGKKASGERLERMRASPQWQGNAFTNPPILSSGSPREPMPLREFFCPKERRKPLAPLPTVDPRSIWTRTPATDLRVTWLGHSTVLIEVAGQTILTDPVWGKRVSPTRGVGPRRFQPVPVSLDQLPPLDVVLLSHDHYDHLDYPTIRTLARSEVPFVAPLGVGSHLEHWGVGSDRITELDWWEHVTLSGSDLTITATPSQHFSGRAPGSSNHTLWCSYALEGPGGRVFFGGDSGMMPGFSDIHDRFGSFDLVLLEVGAYHPAWGDIHMGPIGALEAWEALGRGTLLPIHWGTFDLAIHRWDQPIEVLTARAGRTGVPVLTPMIGEPVEPALGTESTPWWRTVSSMHGPTPDLTDEELGEASMVHAPID